MRIRILTLLAILPLIFTVTTFAEAPELPSFAWERNGVQHWRLNKSGDITDVGAHIFADDMICTVCGSEILDWGDGCFDVTDYDEYGNTLRYTCFDADAAITYESIHVYEYSEDGVALLDQEFIDGVFYGETVYTVNADGEQIPVTMTAYNDDGTTSVNYYDEHGNCVRAAIFEADGTLITETISEYAQTEDEWFGVWYYECKTTTRFADGAFFYHETNEHNDRTRTLNTHADGTVWADTVYEYKYDNSSKVWCRMYSFGVLTRETFFNEDGDTVKEIEHLEDGSTETWLYNENGDTLSVTCTRPDGSIAWVENHVYEYTEDMNIRCIKVYVGDKLIRQTDYSYDEDFSMTGSVETTWHEDGTRTVLEYDDWFDLVSETTYDADGNIIPVQE